MRRNHVNKHRSVRKFRNHVSHTKMVNMRSPMRGGYRF